MFRFITRHVRQHAVIDRRAYVLKVLNQVMIQAAYDAEQRALREAEVSS